MGSSVTQGTLLALTAATADDTGDELRAEKPGGQHWVCGRGGSGAGSTPEEQASRGARGVRDAGVTGAQMVWPLPWRGYGASNRKEAEAGHSGPRRPG